MFVLISKETLRMSNKRESAHAVMEGGGAYNRHAKLPAGGGSLAVPLLEEAARKILVSRRAHQPLVIADYGSSEGKNSLAPMRAAIRVLRESLGPERPISVVHIDQPANDFNTLFEVVHRDPESYVADDANVFCSAIGRSFYENVLPKEHVDLGWSSYAAIWLSRIPAFIPGHFISPASTGEVRAAFQRQAAEDWKAFLSLRAHELRPGGRLVIVLPGLNDDGATGLEEFFNGANAALAELVTDGVITANERAHMVLASYPRTRVELLEPFRADGEFQGLKVEHCEVRPLPDAAWLAYKQDANKEALASRHAGFFRAIFVPSLASALTNDEARTGFADAVEQRLKRRVLERPLPLHTFVQTMMVAKQPQPNQPRTKNGQ
jgi:SAM dependent carboxyl methyltransferase